MASKSLGIVRSRRICCVVGCSSKEAKNSGLGFYTFPGRAQDVKRKESWIKAVNRRDDEGNLWQPSKNSRVCSKHFVNGKKSNDKNSASYIPSIFPDIYYEDPQTQIPTKRSQKKRIFKRLERHTTILAQLANHTLKSEPEECEESIKVSTIGCQTDPWWDQPANESNVLFCWDDGNDNSTQTEIYIRGVERTQRVKIEFPTTPKIEFPKKPETISATMI